MSMKTNLFTTSNVLRDMYLQSLFHGAEFHALICKEFGWTPQDFKQQATGARLFLPADVQNIIRIQLATLTIRLEHTRNYQYAKNRQ